MKKPSIIFMITILVIIGCFAFFNYNLVELSIDSKEGVFNLKGHKFEEESIKLSGKFEFYNNKLLSPETINKYFLDGYYNGNRFWNYYKDLDIKSKGFGTYRAIIYVDKEYEDLAIKSPEIYTEYKLWINGKLLDSNGIDNNKVRYLNRKIYPIKVIDGKIELILQVKNTRHALAGIAESFLLGSFENIDRERDIKLSLDILLLGICIYTGIYHIILFLFRKERKELLCFSIFCFSTGFRGILANEVFIMSLFKNLPYIVGSKLVTLTTALCIVFGVLYFYCLYKSYIEKKLIIILLTPCILYVILVLTLNSFIYSTLFGIFLAFTVLNSIYLISKIIKLFKISEEKTIITLFGIIILFLTIINDILFYYQIIETFYALTLGLAIYIISQTLILAKESHDDYKKSVELSNELKNALEKLDTAEIAFYHSQVKPHFLYNALNTIAEYCITENEIAEKLILDLATYFRGIMSYENFQKDVILDKELKLIKVYTEIEMVRQPSISVNYNIDSNVKNAKLPFISLEALVENSIRHGVYQKKGGNISIDVTRVDGGIKYCVTDDGIGMSKEKIEKALKLDNTEEGIGLYSINRRLKQLHGTSLNIDSTINKGTKVWFIILTSIKS